MAGEKPAPPLPMTTGTWYVWVTASKSEFAEQMCAKLIRRGWTVGPLARYLITEFEDSPSCVIAFTMWRYIHNEEERKEANAQGIHAEVSDVIRHVKGRFWSLVVSKTAECTWNVGLGKLREGGTDKEQAEAAKKVN